MSLCQFNRFDRDLAQRMGVKAGDDMPDVVGLPNPHHNVVDIIFDFDLTIVVGVKAH